MSNDTAIKVENLTKVYKLYDSPQDRLKEALNPLRKKYHRDFYALNDVSFEIKRGETVGIIGQNGAGKSTLLKVITGILTPSHGTVAVNGRISALLELGAGFNPLLTGIENIFFNGAIMGFSKEEINAKLDSILAFADIGAFIHQPVKTYSSGMFVRLAFAVAVHVEPEILIVDEALAVGDMRFKQKCFRKINEFKEKNNTILFVSHDLSMNITYCDTSIWLEKGVVKGIDIPESIAKRYRAFMTGYSFETGAETPVDSGTSSDSSNQTLMLDQVNPEAENFGDGAAEIVGISLFDKWNKKVYIVRPKQTLRLMIKVRTRQEIFSPILGFTLKDKLGAVVLQTNSFLLDQKIEKLDTDIARIFSFEFELPALNYGEYSISPAIASGTQDEHVQHNWVYDALVFQVVTGQNYDLQGYLCIPDIKFSEFTGE